MLKRFILGVIATLFFVFQLPIDKAFAVEIEQDIRTVKLTDQGQTGVIPVKEFERGKRLFGDTCSQCHLAGRTKTNPNVTLNEADLAGAYPPRDSVLAIVDYLEHPTTYDGEVDISEFHPNTTRADLYPEMRNLTQEDLKALAGFLLVQPKIQGIMWGGGKVYN